MNCLSKFFTKSLMLLSFVFLMFFTKQTNAQGGPPMITDDTGTVPKGHREINTAITFERGAD